MTYLDFETLQQVTAQSPGAAELLEYEEYSRRELPRMFQSALENAINQEAEPIAERLRTQLINMIQECQARVFSTYRSHVSRNTPLPLDFSDLPLGTQELHEITQEQEHNLVNTAAQSLDTLESFFQAPPYQHDFSMGLLDLDRTHQQGITNEHERSDSGYVSNLSGHQHYTSSSNGNEILTAYNAFSSDTQENQDNLVDFGDMDLSQTNEFLESFFQGNFLPEVAGSSSGTHVHQ